MAGDLPACFLDQPQTRSGREEAAGGKALIGPNSRKDLPALKVSTLGCVLGPVSPVLARIQLDWLSDSPFS